MITIGQIVSSNLEMLREQESTLEKTLDFVRKAIQLFESQNSAPSVAKPVPVKESRTRTKQKAAPAARASKAPAKTRKREGGTHLERIVAIIKSNNAPMTSGEVIDQLFKQQTAIKDRSKFSKLIYPALTNAYRKGSLKLKRGKIHLEA